MLSRPAPSRTTALALGLVVTFIWATSIVLLRSVLRDGDIDVLSFAGIRFLLGGILLLPLALPSLRRIERWRDQRRWTVDVVAFGLLAFFLAQVGFYVAAVDLPASTVGLLMALAPVVTAIVTLRVARERASTLQLAGIVVLVVGVLAYFGVERPSGDVAIALIAAVMIPIFVGVSLLYGRAAAVGSAPFGGAAAVAAIGMMVGGGGMTISGLIIDGLPAFDLDVWAVILAMAVIHSAIAYALWAQSQRTMRAVESSVLGDVTLIQVALFGWLIIGEALVLTQVAGIGLTLVGVVIVQVAPYLRGSSERTATGETPS